MYLFVRNLCYLFVKRRKQSEFVTALSALEHDPAAQSLTVQSFLILPMQHITRLPLLVDAILHQLDAQPEKQSPHDYAAVNRCLETLHSVRIPLLLFCNSVSHLSLHSSRAATD